LASMIKANGFLSPQYGIVPTILNNVPA